jgi:hypothetical protein
MYDFVLFSPLLCPLRDEFCRMKVCSPFHCTGAIAMDFPLFLTLAFKEFSAFVKYSALYSLSKDLIPYVES